MASIAFCERLEDGSPKSLKFLSVNIERFFLFVSSLRYMNQNPDLVVELYDLCLDKNVIMNMYHNLSSSEGKQNINITTNNSLSFNCLCIVKSKLPSK